MARQTYNWFTGQTVTQSLGSIIAASLGNSVHPSIASNPNLRLTTFSNNELLQLLAKRFPGLSRPITFDPQGLGIGSGVFAQSKGWYSDATFVEPDTWDIDGRLQHRFQLNDSAIAAGYLPRGIGSGAETIVSQPLKADQRIYFEIHMNKYPKQVDSNGVQTTFNNIGGGAIGGGGSGDRYDWNRLIQAPAGLGGEIEITIAPEGWATAGGFEASINRMASLTTKGILTTNAYRNTGYNPSNPHYASYLNIHPANDSDISEVVDGDIFMFAIDGVQDSTTYGRSKLYFGKNGVWAKADSIYNLSTLEQGNYMRNFDPADDSAIRGGWDLLASEDPYHIYISPIWDPSAKDSAAGRIAGDYKYMDIDLTVKTGTDCTYSPPTSGTGKVFKAH